MQKITVGEVELAVAERGRGPALVLLHGFPLDHSMWEPQLAVFSRTHRVVALDLRGFGRSGLAEATVTMDRFAEDVAAVADALGLGERFVLGGLSMGGYVALAFWRKYAGRLAGLILCDTRAEADSPEVAAARQVTAEQVLRDGPAVLLETMLPKLLSAWTRQHRSELVSALGEVILRTDRRGLAAALLGMAQRPDATELLSRIDCPTLVLVGREDPITPPAAMRAMARAIPGARFAEIPRAAHLAPSENPDAANLAIRAFLGR